MVILLTTVRNAMHLYNTVGKKKLSSCESVQTKIEKWVLYLAVRFLVTNTSLHLAEGLQLLDCLSGMKCMNVEHAQGC